jgi:hypothetical protein
MRNALERSINLAAIGHEMSIIMRDGYLEFGDMTVPFNAYRTLFRAAEGYTVNAIERRLVVEEMQTIDQRIDPGVLRAAMLVGLTAGIDE